LKQVSLYVARATKIHTRVKPFFELAHSVYIPLSETKTFPIGTHPPQILCFSLVRKGTVQIVLLLCHILLEYVVSVF
jgi:hypothetical protein